MPGNALPPHLISLIQHVELNKTDWLGTACKKLIVATIWEAERPLTATEISEQLETRFSLSLQADAVARYADSLTSAGIVFRVQDGKHFKISEQAAKEMSSEFDAATKIQ